MHPRADRIAGALLGVHAGDGSAAIPRQWTAAPQFAAEVRAAAVVLAGRPG